MLDGIKKRLIHFESDGKSVVSDFVSARQRRVGAHGGLCMRAFIFSVRRR